MSRRGSSFVGSAGSMGHHYDCLLAGSRATARQSGEAEGTHGCAKQCSRWWPRTCSSSLLGRQGLA